MKENLTKFTALLKYSVKKILLRRRIVVALLGLGFTAAVMGYASTQDVDRLADGAELMELLILSFFLPVISMIYGSSIIRDEIDDRSITHIITSPLDRALSYVGYYLALVICLNLMLVGITTSGFLSFFGPLGVDSASIDIYSSFVGLVFIGSLAYSTLFMLVSLLTSKSIYFGLFYAFIWEGFVGSLPGRIQKVAINHYLKSIGSNWVEYISLNNASGLSFSFYLLIGLTLVLLILGCWLFRRKEFP